jgi:transposase
MITSGGKRNPAKLDLGAGTRTGDDASAQPSLNWSSLDATVPLTTLAETIETWWPAIEVFLSTGLTNARTEGTNRLIKQVKRAACGFRNRDNYRRRVRLHCTRRTRRLSARNPTVPA